ncbi:MAG: SPFH domain-containing protein [Anaerotruncus sp.]|nr:SPFH domain-containing protein [Anaerotruncus sp.]
MKANEVGIVYDPLRGGIQNETFGEGFHVKSIFQEVTKISTTNRTAQVSIYGQTKDSIYALFEITIVYKIESANAGFFYKATGNNDIAESQLNSIVKEALQSASIQFDVYILGDGLKQPVSNSSILFPN